MRYLIPKNSLFRICLHDNIKALSAKLKFNEMGKNETLTDGNNYNSVVTATVHFTKSILDNIQRIFLVFI